MLPAPLAKIREARAARVMATCKTLSLQCITYHLLSLRVAVLRGETTRPRLENIEAAVP